jgi:hypothetical protein
MRNRSNASPALHPLFQASAPGLGNFASPDAPFSTQPLSDGEVSLTPQGVLSVAIHLEDPAVPDLWERFTCGDGALIREYADVLGREAADALGSDFVVTVSMHPGSVMARVHAWVRKGWDGADRAIRGAGKAIKVNLGQLKERLTRAASAFYRRVAEELRWKNIAPRLKAVAKAIPTVVNVLSGLSTLLSYFGMGGDAICALIEQIALPA